MVVVVVMVDESGLGQGDVRAVGGLDVVLVDEGEGGQCVVVVAVVDKGG